MTLKTVLCPADTLLGKVCTACKKKLEKNEISELDVTVSQKLGKLSKIFPLEHVEFKKAIDLEEILVIACTGNIGSLIGAKGKIVSEITRQLGKKTRIIEHTKNERKMVQDLIGDARIIGLKKIFAPTAVEYKIIVNSKDQQKLVAPQKNLEEGLEALLKAKTTIEFE